VYFSTLDQFAPYIFDLSEPKKRYVGKRELSEIIEFTGMKKDVISRSTIYERDKNGKLFSTGYVTHVLEKINQDNKLHSGSFFSNNTFDKRSANNYLNT
jgi:hypothetical protein